MTEHALSADRRRAVESFVADWMATDRVPGAAIAVVDGRELVYAEGFGARSLEDNAAATPDTLFGFASCSKPVTATAVAQLADRGELSVDDPVNEYLPHLRRAPGEPITLRELLTHTSGLPSDGAVAPLVTRPLGSGPVEIPLASRADFRRHVRDAADRRVTDRDVFFYSNTGYMLLTRVVETVTDQSFASYVNENVMAPLAMERSTFSREAFEDETDRMTPYVGGEGDARTSSFPFDSLLHGPGGLLSSVEEMSAFVRMLLDEGDERVLPHPRIEEMTTPVGTFASYMNGHDVGYGYGLMIEEFLDDELVSHGGSLPMSSAWFGYLDGANLGAIVACTTAPESHPMFVGPALLALLQGRKPAEVVPHYRLRSILEAVAGEYGTHRALGSVTIERKGGTLCFEQQSDLGSKAFPLVPTSIEGDVLRCTTVMKSGFARDVRFELDGEGVDLFIGRGRFTKPSTAEWSA